MEESEWKLIYDKYYRSMFLYALSLTDHVQDAEDLLQTTFIKAFLSYKSTGSMKAWLIKVLKNEYISMLRKRKKEVLDGDGYLLEQIRSRETELLEKIIQEEESRNLFFAIQKLPLKSKEILIESVYFHLDDEQIAKEHQMTRENIRQIRFRAKQKLIQMMKEDS